jgi:hypothetical protein
MSERSAAVDGVDALEKLYSPSFDLVLTDIDVDGYAVRGYSRSEVRGENRRLLAQFTANWIRRGHAPLLGSGPTARKDTGPRAIAEICR